MRGRTRPRTTAVLSFEMPHVAFFIRLRPVSCKPRLQSISVRPGHMLKGPHHLREKQVARVGSTLNIQQEEWAVIGAQQARVKEVSTSGHGFRTERKIFPSIFPAAQSSSQTYGGSMTHTVFQYIAHAGNDRRARWRGRRRHVSTWPRARRRYRLVCGRTTKRCNGGALSCGRTASQQWSSW
jgi:hypothetical protein